MNNILQLKGQFQQQNNISNFGPPNLPINGFVDSSHLEALKDQLQRILRFWQSNTLIGGALVSVYYFHVVAKSNRIQGLLCKGALDPNDSIRGSKFHGDKPQHVFTHYVKLDVLQESIHRLEISINIVNEEYKGKITQIDIEAINSKKKDYINTDLKKTSFLKVIVDAFYVQKFDIDQDAEGAEERSIITIYKTDVKTTELLSKLGIDMINAKTIDETTIRLNPDEIKLLKEKAPYLISMKVRDLREVTPEAEKMEDDPRLIHIPSPGNEPVVGVIDTPFSDKVYFKEWVTYVSVLDEGIELDYRDFNHGTEVTSIIVDGPVINPELDDGCGRFRVRHFGVAKAGRFSSFSVLKAIRDIVAKNQDIKVWNLSLGSDMPINRDFISPEAAELDRIQSEYDIVFVIAGTNRKQGSPEKLPIGAPADSLNSVVVNAVDFDEKPASYYRVGPVLSFFHKPDVSYYGGDKGQPMKVCTPCGEGYVMGTSFSAPWISRKMAYLIYNMGFTREVAKALLIDAAAGWNRKDDISNSIGYGVVPQKIERIVQTQNDEIRFIMTGSSDSYETYTYNIPIPIYNNKQPFFARATLCYFPKCSRNQGVDYTSTEMDIHFGRVKEDKGKATIKSLNANKQGNEGFNPLLEEEARKLYRKWDNVKLISDIIKDGAKPRKVYGSGTWGLSIKVKERLRQQNGRGLKFGVVVTLKEMSGENRIDDFMKLCMVRGWVVNQIDVNNRFDIYNKAEEDISFE